MSAHTTMNHSRRETLTHLPSPSVKRKERERERERHPFNGNVNVNVLKPLPLTTKELAKPSPHHRPASPSPNKQSQKPASNNQLLAGYLAHEFLTKGTLLGQPWDPTKAEAVSRLKLALSENSKRKKTLAEPRGSKEDEGDRVQKYQRYMDVADLLKTDGAHLPGVVNPTQLARFLQLG